MSQLSLSELDAIPYVTETDFIIDPTQFERIEQLAAAEFIRPEHRVLELGGCYGLVSCVINHRLRVPSQHVVVEPFIPVLPALLRNRDTHQAEFQVYCGIIARQSGVIHGEGLSRWIELRDDGNLPYVTIDELEAHHGFTFNCLVADCEGALPRFLYDFPDFLDALSLVLFERDRESECQDKPCNYGFVENLLERNGFSNVRGGSHPVWLR